MAANAGLRRWTIGRAPERSDPWDIGCDWWRDIADQGLDARHQRTVVLVRDPRDVIVSGMRFHCRSGEPWLHVPQPKLQGQTYQQALLGLESDEARYLFELRHPAGATIADMLRLKRSPAHRDTLFLPLETLMQDRTLGTYRRVFAHLGVVEAYMPLALSVAFKHALFNPGFQASGHITSGQPATWRRRLPDTVVAAYEAAYPGAAQELGYPV